MNKKLCLLILSLWIGLSNAKALVFHGSCGEHVNYELNMSTGALAITGKGAISTAPWSDMSLEISGNTISISNVSINTSNEQTCNDILRSVVIGEGVTSISDEVFCNCRQLSSVSLPESMETIGKYTFANCGIKQIILPKNLKSIGEGAFAGCDSLQSVSIPEGITSIPKAAFLNCSHLKHVVIPSTVTDIGLAAFQLCIKLDSVRIPGKILSIGHSAFAECISLRSLYIGDVPQKYVHTPKKIYKGYYTSSIEVGWEAFYGCAQLKQLSLPVAMVTTKLFSGRYLPQKDSIQYIYHGKEGKNILWTLDVQNELLTINGQGIIPSRPSWGILYPFIKKANISKGITAINSYAFVGDYDEYEKDPDIIFHKQPSFFYNVSLPCTLREIKKNAFYNMPVSTFTLHAPKFPQGWFLTANLCEALYIEDKYIEDYEKYQEEFQIIPLSKKKW